LNRMIRGHPMGAFQLELGCRVLLEASFAGGCLSRRVGLIS
jgi:hypothetical protein